MIHHPMHLHGHFWSYVEEKDQPTIGVQWYGGIDGPSRLRDYPDQTYWCKFYFILICGRTRFTIEIRGKEMPYRNYDEFILWYKSKQRAKLQTTY